ncbi:MAG: S24 family peptidase [Acidobacteriota bacterium]|nr:S24 family peptidase [Acidobacteriota bacterium]
MPSAVTSIDSKRRAQFSLLELALPGERPIPIGVFLIDPESGNLDFKLREDWDDLAGAEDAEFLASLQDDFTLKAAEAGGEAFLASLEDSLSNILRVTEREPVIVSSFSQTLENLFTEHVDTRVRPFITHLPLYSLRAAATKFGEDSEAGELDWVKAPAGLRLSEGMFVAKVVGRSMEPLIPDGSLCIFRSPVVGSRQGKRLLIEQFGVSDSSARYTVKRYTSRKTQAGTHFDNQADDEEWSHSQIRLEPLNPGFPAFDLDGEQFRVLGEFVQVLD